MIRKNKWHIDPFDGYSGNLEWLSERTIFATVHGSQAYGTSTPESDIDIKGLCIPPKEYFYSFAKNFEQIEMSQPYDTVIYDIRKFFKLASDCNPNIIEILFTDPSDWLLETELYRKLWEQRQLFLSKKARWTFSGYAISQLKRIKSHRAWLLNPPTHKPTRSEFNLPTNKKLSSSEVGAAKKLCVKYELDTNIMYLFQREQKYQAKLREWNQYQQWKKLRNRERSKMEEAFGFDGKHALHLVRLMKMCEEILAIGEVRVKRPDFEELLEIRNGKWTYEQLISWAEEKEKCIEALYERSLLPSKPPLKKLEKLCVDLIEASIL